MRTPVLVSGVLLCLVALLAAPAAQAEEPSPAPASASGASELPDGDVVELTDGRRLTGEVVGEDDHFVSIRSGGVLRAYPRSSVVSIIRAQRSEPVLPPPTISADSTKKARKETKGAKKARRNDLGADAPLSPDARAWLLGLLERARSADATDPAVRKSLAAAIQALGPAALNDIKRVTASAAAGERDLLEQIAQSIEKRQAKRTASDGARPAGTGAIDESSGTMDESAGPATSDDAAGSPGETGESAPKSPRERLMDLGLTPEQGLEMRTVLETYGAAAREIFLSVREGSLPRPDARAEFADLRTAAVASIRQILDPTQLAEFETFADDLLDPRKSGRAGKSGKKAKRKSKQPAE